MKYFIHSIYKVSNIKMQTRSQTRSNNIGMYKVEIDFDDASQAWKANKKSVGNGCYKYYCCGKTKEGKSCNRIRLSDIYYCRIHNK